MHFLEKLWKHRNIKLVAVERFRNCFVSEPNYHTILKVIAKSKINKNENGENAPILEISKVVLVYCNIVSDDYQQDSRVLYTFAPNKSSSQLLDISSIFFLFLKPFNSEFSYIDLWFTDQNSKPPDREYRVNINLVIN